MRLHGSCKDKEHFSESQAVFFSYNRHADFHNKEAIVCQGKGVELFDSVIAKQIEDISEDISDQLTAYLSIKVYLRITVD